MRRLALLIPAVTSGKAEEAVALANDLIFGLSATVLYAGADADEAKAVAERPPGRRHEYQ